MAVALLLALEFPILHELKAPAYQSYYQHYR